MSYFRWSSGRCRRRSSPQSWREYNNSLRSRPSQHLYDSSQPFAAQTNTRRPPMSHWLYARRNRLCVSSSFDLSSAINLIASHQTRRGNVFDWIACEGVTLGSESLGDRAGQRSDGKSQLTQAGRVSLQERVSQRSGVTKPGDILKHKGYRVRRNSDIRPRAGHRRQ